MKQTVIKNGGSFSGHFVVSKLFDHRCHGQVTSAYSFSVIAKTVDNKFLSHYHSPANKICNGFKKRLHF